MKYGAKYWTYQPTEQTPEFSDVFPKYFSGDERGWHQLSPGMRREIYRQAKRAETAQ